MSIYQHQYILDSDIVVPTGMNTELAIAIARADIDRFATYEDGNEKYTVASLEFVDQTCLMTKVQETLNVLITPLLDRLHVSLKPLPLLLSVPQEISEHDLRNWIDESDFSDYLSNIKFSKNSGNAFLQECLNSLAEPDAIMCIAIDSLYEKKEALMSSRDAMSGTNPWGVLPSEGGAGMVLTKRNVLDTLKLIPQSKIVYSQFDWHSSDRRGCARLIRAASKHHDNLGPIYSDMTNQRAHTEDYGFAIGARSEVIPYAQQVTLTNEFWGTIGGGSGIATLATMNHLSSVGILSTAFLFDQNNTRSLFILNREK
ncbi:hypothetical protein [Aliivibrio fischeri]|uniref:hypothetical protein n=1 Tax=Aliivibrio fischeri TaxID=668 RepID=UPI00080E2D76|nr:hypothetical protein [Aliivibrio fischeri]MUH96010.1 hypothetical protein [Aliivibrio fischeri]MUI62711.1 hypothetical protein [Aliivibrio fischeri]OCH07653.1 hypothetical protein A6E11_15715 [Aliivibrio fischeri]USR96957.1 hypothetical protein AVFI_17355 [Aliivibrio fischeri ATCC 7744 = JCM 18803 = DSM 507]GGK42376.1 hypothetical protein GCM10007987_27010 [Aliivibrio fischeri]